MIFEPTNCLMVCSSCGCIDEDSSALMFVQEIGVSAGKEGSAFIRGGKSGAGPTDQQAIDNSWNRLAVRVRLIWQRLLEMAPPPYVDAVLNKLKRFVGQALAPQAAYMDVLIAAALFATCRLSSELAGFSFRQVCDAAGCNLYEVSSVFSRMKKDLGLRIETRKPHDFVDRMALSISPETPASLLARVKRKTGELLDVAVSGLLHVGFRPEPMCFAALSLVCDAYNVVFDSKQAAAVYSVTDKTANLRQKELCAHLGTMAQVLPLGITPENVKSHLYYLINELDVVAYVHRAHQNVRILLRIYKEKKEREMPAAAAASEALATGEKETVSVPPRPNQASGASSSRFSLLQKGPATAAATAVSQSQPKPVLPFFNTTQRKAAQEEEEARKKRDWDAGSRGGGDKFNGKVVVEEDVDDDEDFDEKEYLRTEEEKAYVALQLELQLAEESTPAAPPRKRKAKGGAGSGVFQPLKKKCTPKRFKDGK